jgi:hypothetical protein
MARNGGAVFGRRPRFICAVSSAGLDSGCLPSDIIGMRRTPSRLFGALTMLWSLVVLGGPTVVHPCPAHGEVVGAVTAGMSHDAAVMHHAGMSHEAPSRGAAPHQCQCPGGCCASATIAIGASMAVERYTTESLSEAAPFLVSLRVAVARAAYALPFANGPPADGLL